MFLFSFFPSIFCLLKKPLPAGQQTSRVGPFMSFSSCFSFMSCGSQFSFFLSIFFSLTFTSCDAQSSPSVTGGDATKHRSGCCRGSRLPSVCSPSHQGWASATQLEGLQSETEVSLRKREPRPRTAASAPTGVSCPPAHPADLRRAGSPITPAGSPNQSPYIHSHPHTKVM